MMLVSAYGMLLSFPFQEYGVFSIVFSTLSPAAVLLGFISVFAFAAVLKTTSSFNRFLQNTGVRLFLFAFITTELSLVLQAAGYLNFLSPYVNACLLFGLSVFFRRGYS